jgi:phenylacetic acid degradation operon negative regulatory protein
MQSKDPGIRQLVELETLKTWSLIVTLFGDLDGQELTGSQIKSLLGHIGIKPEAIRTALYRLKSDGWIRSEKRGREAFYKLSRKGHEQTLAVTDDIYGQSNRYRDGWQFVYHKDNPTTHDAISLSKDLFVMPVERNTCKDNNVQQCLSFNLVDNQIPDWFVAKLAPEPIQRNASTLIAVVSDNPADYTVQDALVLRLLVLHHWRKLALRPASWALMWFEPSNVLTICQQSVTTFLCDTNRIKAESIK